MAGRYHHTSYRGARRGLPVIYEDPPTAASTALSPARGTSGVDPPLHTDYPDTGHGTTTTTGDQEQLIHIAWYRHDNHHDVDHADGVHAEGEEEYTEYTEVDTFLSGCTFTCYACWMFFITMLVFVLIWLAVSSLSLPASSESCAIPAAAPYVLSTAWLSYALVIITFHFSVLTESLRATAAQRLAPRVLMFFFLFISFVCNMMLLRWGMAVGVGGCDDVLVTYISVETGVGFLVWITLMMCTLFCISGRRQ